ncbi:MAG: NAD(P)-dependent alcohol dehydrogenase [Pseudomonadota bacterium]
MEIKAAVTPAAGQAFVYESLHLETPRDDEVLVQIKGVGICHTDLVVSGGGMPFPFPAVLGHEGAGIVKAVGTKVSKVTPGDHVLISFRSCGSCDRCDQGRAAYCRSSAALNYSGRREDGTTPLQDQRSQAVSANFFGQSSFATEAITYERNVVPVDASLPIELLGPLGCGVQTGVGSILRSLKVEAGSSVLIVGGGAVGLSAVMGAVIAGCSHIVLVEPVEARRTLAKEFGATATVDPVREPEWVKGLRRAFPLGFDFALDTSGAAPAQEGALKCLASMGTLGLVGLGAKENKPPGRANLLVTNGQTIRGILEGDSDPDTFLPELVSYFQQGRLPFDRMIQTFPLARINEAVDAVHRGSCIKAVLIPDEPSAPRREEEVQSGR